MAVRPILSIFRPNESTRLRRPAQRLEPSSYSDLQIGRLIDDLLDTMRAEPGIGLAATQIGQELQIAVVAKETDPGLSSDLVLINPVITAIGSATTVMEEGCLSVPGVFGLVRRPKKIRLQAINNHGESYTIEAQGLLARVIQHESDHLRGVLFIDLAPKLTTGRELL